MAVHPPSITDASDTRTRMARIRRAGDVPRVRRDQPDPRDRHAKLLRRLVVRLFRGLEALGVVCRERGLKEIAQTGGLQLRFLDREGGVRQRRQAKARIAQTLEALTYLGMRRKGAHLAEDRLLVLIRERHAIALGRLSERGPEMRAEIDVRPGDGKEERRLQHRPEPLATHLRVAEQAREMRVERREVEERLVHIEDEDALATGAHQISGTRR